MIQLVLIPIVHAKRGPGSPLSQMALLAITLGIKVAITTHGIGGLGRYCFVEVEFILVAFARVWFLSKLTSSTWLHAFVGI